MEWLRFRSLRERLLLLFALVPLLLLGSVWLQHRENAELAYAEAITEVRHVAQLLAMEQRRAMNEAAQLLAVLALDPALGDPALGAGECQRAVDALHTHAPHLAFIGLASRDGLLICSSPATGRVVGLSDRHYFRRAATTCRPTVGHAQIGRVSKQPVIAVALPRCKGGEMRRVLIASLPLSNIESLIETTSLPRQTRIDIYDSETGRILLRYEGGIRPPDHPAYEEQLAPDITRDLKPLYEGRIDTLTIRRSGRLLIALGAGSVESGPAHVAFLFSVPAEAVDAPWRQTIQHMLLITAAALGVALLAWHGTTRSVIFPIRRLEAAAQRLREGDFTARAPQTAGTTELAELAASFNRMAEQMGADNASLREKNREIERLNRLYAVLSHTNSTIVRVHDTSIIFHEVTRGLVEIGYFRAAWLVIAPPSGEPKLVAVQGTEAPAVPDRATLSRHRLPVIHNELEPDEPTEWLAQTALRNGCRSAAAFPVPLVRGGGLLCLCAVEPNAFAQREILLLDEMVGDIAFAVENLERERRFQYLQYRDPLTGLSNRAAFHERLREYTERHHNDAAALLVVRFDEFVRLNTYLGRHIGDALLKRSARALENALGVDAIISRLGSAEFGILLPGCSNAEALGARLDAVDRAFPGRLTIENEEVFARLRGGIAFFPIDAVDAEHLLRCAYTALDQAYPHRERNSYRFYTAEMNRVLARRFTLEKALRQALADGAFELHYQPQLEMRQGRVIGVEALLRWHHPELGQVPPDLFIPIAEEIDLIGPLGRWVIEEACRQSVQWREAFGYHGLMAVNVSAKQFGPALIGEVESAIAGSGIDPSQLELELTETAIVEDDATLHDILERMRGAGIRLALDDFGTGYSNLGKLKHYPFHKLKIDKGFISGITTRPDDAAIARTIIAMAKSMGMEVIAEGVETAEEFQYLRRNRCDQMQGYYFSRPLPAVEIEQTLRSGKRVEVAEIDEDLSRNSLLIVDDDSNTVHALRRVLRRDGYRILSAGSAEKALALLATDPVGVILCDQRMPGMTGSEFLGRVKDLHPDTVRILLTGYAQIDTVTRAVNTGAVFRFLTKPWEDNELRRHIREAFEQHAAMKV